MPLSLQFLRLLVYCGNCLLSYRLRFGLCSALSQKIIRCVLNSELLAKFPALKIYLICHRWYTFSIIPLVSFYVDVLINPDYIF